MKGKRNSAETIVAALKEHEGGASAAEICRRLGIAENTFYRWKSKYGGLELSEAKRLKELEEENGRLKRMVADLLLRTDALEAVLAKKW